METLEQQLGNLSPDQRRLVELWLRQQASAAEPPSAGSIPQRHATDTAPLSFVQQRLWFLHQLEPESAAYNLRTIVRLIGPLDSAVLERSLNELVRRHETLRTTFVSQDGQPRQVIAPVAPILLPVVALDTLPPAEQEAQIQQLARSETEQPFDLAHGPLVRACLLHLGPQNTRDEHVLLLTMHHIISDGWSQGVQLRELMAVYAALVQGKPSPLLELPIQYADYALWQQSLQQLLLSEQLAYWKAQLGQTAHVLELPTDRPRPTSATHRGAWDYWTIPASLLDQLKALSRREGVTLFMTLLAAFDVLLYRYTSQHDVVVGTPVAGRNRQELEGLIGCFVNMLALRVDLGGNPTFRELLQRVRGITLGAYAHQELPFEKLVEELNLTRDLSRNPIFQVMLALQNAPMPPLHGAGLTLLPMEVSATTATLDLALYMREVGSELQIRAEYATDLFDDSTIRRMLGHFHTLLAAIAADTDRRIAALLLLTEAERHQLLLTWNDTRMAYPPDDTLPELFQAQAARTPDAVAVVCEDHQLTYRTLNQRANQLAHYLRARGVGGYLLGETLVGVCMERSAEMVVAVLGIVKAGAAYMPLDPAYPQERLRFMLADTQVQVILTQSDLCDQLPPPPQATPALRRTVICLDTAWQTIAQASTENPVCAISPEQMAYVVYTSGSTGRPKGVLGLHRGILNRLYWM